MQPCATIEKSGKIHETSYHFLLNPVHIFVCTHGQCADAEFLLIAQRRVKGAGEEDEEEDASASRSHLADSIKCLSDFCAAKSIAMHVL